MIILALFIAFLSGVVPCLMLIRLERINAAREAVARHRISVVWGGQVIVDATVLQLEHLAATAGRKMRPGETRIVLGIEHEPRDAAALSRSHAR